VSKQLENVINAADDGSETASIDSEEMSSSPDKVSATTVRIKKAEKLTNFFGDQVPVYFYFYFYLFPLIFLLS